MSSFKVQCPAQSCGFVGSAARLSNARRAVRGHALRIHGKAFDAQRNVLVDLEPEELQRQLESFRSAQRNSSRRRQLRARASGGSWGLPRVVGSGPEAGSGTLGGPRPSGACIDISAAQLPMDDDDLGSMPDVNLLDVETGDGEVQGEYVPPRGYSVLEMVDFLETVSGRRPSSAVSILCGPLGPVDQAAAFWIRVAAQLQRRMGATLRNEVEDAICVDPTGRRAYDEAMTHITRWSRRPLDAEDE